MYREYANSRSPRSAAIATNFHSYHSLYGLCHGDLSALRRLRYLFGRCAIGFMQLRPDGPAFRYPLSSVKALIGQYEVKLRLDQHWDL